MTTTYDAFKSNKKEIVELLTKLNQLLQQGSQYGLQLPSDFEEKLTNSIHSLENKKLKIALIGGFSEGKTSIAAAWLDKIDPKSMNISASESSNEVAIYNIDDKYELVDTPGLFGYKEKYNAHNEVQKYKDITKHYVSEANIILYVMNGKNPIKQSNTEDIIWLFKELNLLPRTVFILGRFDEVADVEDEQEYKEMLAIKQENVRSRLKEILNLSQNEVDNLKIVGVSANPFDQGIDYWLKNKEEFKQLSHIETLQKATIDLVQENGGHDQIIQSTKNTIFRDVMGRELPLLKQEQQSFMYTESLLRDRYEKENRRLQKTENQINDARFSLNQFVNDLFIDLIAQVNRSSLETIGDIYQREIGDDGYILSSKLENKFNAVIGHINHSIDSQLNTIRLDIENDNAFASLTKNQTIKLLKNTNINSGTILAARDGIVAVGQFIGVNLKEVLKFKPWGAVNLAGNINKALPFLAIGIEVWDSWNKAKKEDEFNKSKKELAQNLTDKHKKLLEDLNSEHFRESFPDLHTLQKTVIEFENEAQALQNKKASFDSWYKECEIIEGEFTLLDSK